MKNNDPFFYVQLRDNFRERIQETGQASIFEDMKDPYREAAGRLRMERVYPVVGVPSNRDLVVLDDQGLPFRTSSNLFKFTSSQKIKE